MIDEKNTLFIEDFIMDINKQLRYTSHILLRLLQRGITTDDVETALINGEVIETYPDDYPHPSYLVFGHTKEDRVLHIVCGVSSTELWLITAYYPNNIKWLDDFKTRRKDI